MKPTPHDILLTLKKTVDGMVESIDRRIHALASGLEILSKLGQQNDERISRLERVALRMLANQNLPLSTERETMAAEIRAGIEERAQARKTMLDALRGGQ
jgi:hypothetical protein